MKYIKTFEKINKPQEGEYAVAYSKELGDDVESSDWVKNNVGQIIRYFDTIDKYRIQYYNVPGPVLLNGDNTFWFFGNEILFSSQNKEDCELYINSNKYNL